MGDGGAATCEGLYNIAICDDVRTPGATISQSICERFGCVYLTGQCDGYQSECEEQTDEAACAMVQGCQWQ